MAFLSLFKRLWVKVAFATILVVIATTELVVRFSIEEQLSETHRVIREDLQHRAAMAACIIPGELHNQALLGISDTNAAFQLAAHKLMSLRNAASFKEHWYTLVPLGGDSACFGVMSHPEPFSGHMHYFRDSTVLAQFNDVVHEKVSIATDVYSDDNGDWISGMAPIMDSAGTVVAVLEVDLTAHDLMQQTQRVYESMNEIRFLGISGAVVVGLFVGLLIGRPINRVNRAVQALTESNFSRNVTIPKSVQLLPDETSELIISVNILSSRLQSTLNELRDAHEKLSHLDKAKTTFLHFLTHELRTPISGLLLLRHVPEVQDDLLEDTAEIISASVESTERLHRLSLGAEKYVRALSHAPDFSEPSCIVTCVKSVLIDALPGGDRSDVFVDGVGEEACMVLVPEHVLSMIFDPLIRNALKFGGEPLGLTIDIAKQHGDYVVAISDTGVGFDPQHAKALLEPFFVDDIMGHSEGTGVSLAIAAVMAEHYGGKVVPHSKGKGQGSTFTVYLPVAL